MFRITVLLKDKKFTTLHDATIKLTDGTDITIPGGFCTDLASVPRIFRGIIPPYGKYTDAAVIHDYLYRHPLHGKNRKFADLQFLHYMVLDNVKSWKMITMYCMVRLFGGKFYRG